MGLMYYANWVDMDDHAHRLEIHRASAVTSSEIDIVGFTIDQPEVDPLSDDSCVGAGANIAILSNTRLAFFEPLYTNNPIAIAVRHYIDGDINFDGFLDPEQYSDPIGRKVNYPITFTANNGIKLLDRYKISGELNANLTGVIPAIKLIKWALSKTTIGFENIYIGLTTDIENQGSPTSSVLHLSYCRADNYYDEKGDAMTCREAINSILIPLAAKLYIHKHDIYILDINTLCSNNLALKQFNYNTLNYVQTISMPNYFEIDELINLSENVSMQSGANKVSIKLSKYAYSSPRSTELSSSNYVGNPVTTQYSAKVNDKTYIYKDHVYPGGYMGNVFTLNNALMVRQEEITEDKEALFIRLLSPFNSGQNNWVTWRSGVFITSSKQFVKITGDIMVEYITKYGAEYGIGNWNAALIPFRVGVIHHETGELYTYTSGFWQSPGATQDKMTGYLAPWRQSTTPYMVLNKWYDISKMYYYREDDPLTPQNEGDDYFARGMLINLNSDESVTPANRLKTCPGGELVVTFFSNNGLGQGASLYSVNVCLKNLGLSFYELNEKGKFVEIEDSDSEVIGQLDANFLKGLEVETKLGSDPDNNCRAALIAKVTGSYHDSDYMIGERLVNAVAFTRAGRTGTVEELLLNTYLSNFQNSRYKLTCTVDYYVNPFATFFYSLLSRAGNAVKLLIAGQTVDYVNQITEMKLVEFVGDELDFE